MINPSKMGNKTPKDTDTKKSSFRKNDKGKKVIGPKDVMSTEMLREYARSMHKAQKEAEDVMKSAEEQKQQLVNEHEITKKAYDQANEVLASAQKNAREIRLGARQYADDVLAGIETRLGNMSAEIRAGREELRK